MELLKSILRWFLLILFIVIIIYLTVRLTNRKDTTKTKTKEPTVNIVEKNNKTDVDTEKEEDKNKDKDESLIEINTTESTQDALTVDSPDTASSGIKEIILGIAILGFASSYIYKHQSEQENS